MRIQSYQDDLQGTKNWLSVNNFSIVFDMMMLDDLLEVVPRPCWCEGGVTFDASYSIPLCEIRSCSHPRARIGNVMAYGKCGPNQENTATSDADVLYIFQDVS